MSSKSLDISILLSSSIHEIKNQINSMIFRLESLQAQHPESHSDIVFLKQDATYIGNELVRLLALYKLNEKELRPQQMQHGVEDFLEDRSIQHHATSKAKHIQLEYHCDENLTAFFDEHLIACVLDTAIHNSLRFAQQHIHISAQKHSPFTVLSIEDDGPGYPQELLAEQDFSNPQDSEGSNTGLGLYFAAQIAACHENKDQSGYIALTNESRFGGAKFSVYLP
ncbi:MAG: hypothetical protein COB04_12350 [Gammaproteobacteria bacterium]|nr:MAG: hypothetical protein COB04_12350 [Gammaproteobacteria bacterium]